VFFIVLEAVSLTLLFNSYSYHKTLAFSTVNNLTGGVYSSYNNLTEFFALRHENKKLANENAYLRNQLLVKSEAFDSVLVQQDSQYYYRVAKVISNSVNKQNNYILINKGANENIKPEMGVISSNGVVGIVVGTSSNYAYIMSLLHQNSRVSARIKKNSHLVNVLWEGQNYTNGLVVDIPSHLKLIKGDSIVTSGNSLIFPQGILVGTIDMYMQNQDKDLSKATIKFSTAFNKLKHVYIIENKAKPEADSLMSVLTN
jgi:rod shape-determining protein MreC